MDDARRPRTPQLGVRRPHGAPRGATPPPPAPPLVLSAKSTVHTRYTPEHADRELAYEPADEKESAGEIQAYFITTATAGTTHTHTNQTQAHAQAHKCSIGLCSLDDERILFTRRTIDEDHLRSGN